MRRIAALLLPWILPWLGCTPAMQAPGDGGSGGDASGPPSYANVVDAVLLPMLAANGLPYVPEQDDVLCRRLAIDLTGLAPTEDETKEQCEGHTPADMAGYFMNKPSGLNVPAADASPPYVFVNRRWWADRFQYQSNLTTGSTFWDYVRDLDGLVGQLYTGTIKYDEFARQALASPAFARRFGVFEANHDLVQIASQAFRVFLGREALSSEAEDFGNLWRGWTTKYMTGQTALQVYGQADCPLSIQTDPNPCQHHELGLDGSQCAGQNLASCQSTVLGAGQIVPSTVGFVPWIKLSAADRAQLETPGRLIAAQPEFAEAAVDAALEKYLGWWKAGAYRPDFDVPAVRDALVAKFVADGYDVRKMELEIVTSAIYTQAAARQMDESATDPIWAFGPTKMLYAEAWLDMLSQATGKKFGGCDFRFNDFGNGSPLLPGYWYPLPNYYPGVAQNMGGCPNASTHTPPGGLVSAITRRTELAALCPGSFRPAAQSSLDALVDLEFAGVGRPAASDERASIIAHLTTLADGGCDPSNLAACNLQPIADGLCAGLYASAPFTFY